MSGVIDKLIVLHKRGKRRLKRSIVADSSFLRATNASLCEVDIREIVLVV